MVGWGKKTQMFSSRMAEKLPERRDKLYSVMMSWIRRKFPF